GTLVGIGARIGAGHTQQRQRLAELQAFTRRFVPLIEPAKGEVVVRGPNNARGLAEPQSRYL
ncbi:MAG: hypothetical protein WCB03_13650, partial [Rouxiella badensis]|uniref:hypothetical protein n=1 Tax=Rouxiella badensis TaxID=1646377 RepID=UPI003C332F4C